MKWTSLLLAALASVATACVVDLGNLVTCPSKTINNVVANFDDRPNAQVVHHYRHLNYNNVTVEEQGTSGPDYRGISPHSKPHYGIAFPNNTNGGRITLSLEGTETTSFDFHGVYAGCLAQYNIRSGYEALPCNISIDCATYLSFEGHLGPQTFEYVPSSEWDAKLKHMQPSGYEFCQEVTIDFAFEAPPFETVIVIDDVNYTVREGECIPGSPGDPGPKCKN